MEKETDLDLLSSPLFLLSIYGFYAITCILWGNRVDRVWHKICINQITPWILLPLLFLIGIWFLRAHDKRKLNRTFANFTLMVMALSWVLLYYI